MQSTSAEIINLFLVSTAIILLMIVLVVVFMVVYQRRLMHQKIRLETIAAEAQRQKQLAIIQTQEEERIRIARDLHDQIGAHLSAVKIGFKILAPPESQGKPEWKNAFQMLDEAIQSVRRTAHDLLPPTLETLGLAASLESFAQKVESVTGVPFHTHGTADTGDESLLNRLALFRVVQECVQNSIKHADASERWLEWEIDPKAITIRFQDNGKGFGPTNIKAGGKGLGLQNMSTRMEYMGGTFTLESAAGNGVRINLYLPNQGHRPQVP